MTKATKLIEEIELLESNPFQNHGFTIDKHVLMSPFTVKEKFTKKNKVFGPKHIKHGKGRRTLTIYKVKEPDEENKEIENHYGVVHNRTLDKHPKDINIYKLNKRLKNDK